TVAEEVAVFGLIVVRVKVPPVARGSAVRRRRDRTRLSSHADTVRAVAKLLVGGHQTYMLIIKRYGQESLARLASEPPFRTFRPSGPVPTWTRRPPPRCVARRWSQVYRDRMGLRLSTGPGRWALIATVLGSSIALLDATVVNVALPRTGRDL